MGSTQAFFSARGREHGLSLVAVAGAGRISNGLRFLATLYIAKAACACRRMITTFLGFPLSRSRWECCLSNSSSRRCAG